jgi:RNA polymerase sigma factor (sigma-70 family)
MAANVELYPLFEKLFKEYYNTLANYALSIVKNRADAEDVVQDVFVKLWQNSPQVVNTDQVKYYLYTATKNTCITLLRKQAGKILRSTRRYSESYSRHQCAGNRRPGSSCQAGAGIVAATMPGRFQTKPIWQSYLPADSR